MSENNIKTSVERHEQYRQMPCHEATRGIFRCIVFAAVSKKLPRVADITDHLTPV